MYLDRYPHELSGGQRQRVAIATALVLGPQLLLADEPVSMLDVSVRAGVLSLLDSLRRDADMGILMITHDLSTAAHFADKIAVMYLGRIVEHGTASEVVRNPQHPYTKALLSVVPKRDPRETSAPQILTGETPDPVDVPLRLPVPSALPDRGGSVPDRRPCAPGSAVGSRHRSPGRVSPDMSGPVAPRVPSVRELHGRRDEDDYAWMRDHAAPALREYLDSRARLLRRRGPGTCPA